MFFVVGGKGLTGSAIVSHLNSNGIENKIIQRENKEDFLKKKCDVLIFANGNALKHKANSDPFFDFHASVTSLVDYVQNIDYKLFVHLSTVDVYDKKSSLNFTMENMEINPKNLDTYGYHKFLAEDYVRHFCKKYIIFRLPGLVGTGLKKNPVYDFVHDEKKVTISPNSFLNFIHTEFVARTIYKMIESGFDNEIFNLASRNSIQIRDIKKIVGFDSEYSEDAHLHLQDYKINIEKIQKYVKMPTSEESIHEYYESIRHNLKKSKNQLNEDLF